MKPLRTALATLLLAALPVAAQDADPPVPVAAETAAEPAVHPVPPVRLTNIVVQTIGEERHNEELRPGLLFIDESSGKLMVSDESNPHGRFVCACKDFPDYHNFTNTIRVNGNKIELNQAFSLQAENDILSFRFGTNSVFQIVGSDIGDYAPFYATPESQESYLLHANVQAEQAVLQVCTNLLEANGWRTDTVSEIIETTDASVTWRVPIGAGSEPEFRRVLSANQMPAGIYALQPIVAEQGIEMGGERWTEWPDMEDYASTQALAAAEDRVDSILGQIEDINAEMEDFVTLNDLPTATTTNQGIVQLYNGATSGSTGMALVPDALNRFANGALFTAPGYSSSSTYRIGDRVRYGYSFFECVADGTKEIAPDSNSVKWKKMNIQNQIDALTDEYWCSWAMSLLSTNSNETNWIPTDWPARKVHCSISLYGSGSCNIAMPDWTPEEPCELHLYLRKSGTNLNVKVLSPNLSQLVITTSSFCRIVDFYWRKNTGWVCCAHNLATMYGPSGTTPPDNSFLPSTNSPVAQTLAMSPSLAPSLSPVVSPSLTPELSPLVFENVEPDAIDLEEEAEELEEK